jgi:outer membrane protein TolC
MEIPLTTGGTNAGVLKEAVSEWKKAKYSSSLTRREAQLEVKQAYQNWISSLKQYKLYEEAANASDQNLTLQKEDYSRSLVSNLDVLAALETLNDTRRNSNRVFYEMKQNYWRLKIAMGDCCESV